MSALPNIPNTKIPAFVGTIPAEVFQTIDSSRADKIASIKAGKIRAAEGTPAAYRVERLAAMDSAYHIAKPGQTKPYFVNVEARTCNCPFFKSEGNGCCGHLFYCAEIAVQEMPAVPVIGTVKSGYREYTAPDPIGSRMAPDSDLIEAFLMD